jgi:PAS domain S-box-containing protein
MVNRTLTTAKALRTRVEKLTRQALEQGSLARAIQGGEVDAVVVLEREGPKLYRLKSDEPLYRTMIENMAHGFATVLSDGTPVYANPHLLAMVGQTERTFLGSNILPYVAPADRPLFEAMLHAALTSPCEFEVSFQWASGEGPVLVAARRLPITETEAIGLAFADLREQRARRAAEESSNAKDELLAAVSHELRTPLTSMMGWVQLLESEFAADSHVSFALRNLKMAVTAEARIVDDLLDLSRSQRASLDMAMEVFDLRETLETAASYVTLQAESKSVSLGVRRPDQPVLVRGDSSRLRQVFVNLLTNALKFTEADGTVEMTLVPSDLHVEARVTDSGIGISSDFLPFVFEPFRRGDLARPFPGLGIGLAIAKRIVEMHGGSITASSDGIGRGASFIVRLPVTD